MEDEKDSLEEYNYEKRIIEYHAPLFQNKLRELVLLTWEGLVYDAHDINKKLHPALGSVLQRKEQLKAYSQEVENLTLKYSKRLIEIDNSRSPIIFKIQGLKDLREELNQDNTRLNINIKALTNTKITK